MTPGAPLTRISCSSHLTHNPSRAHGLFLHENALANVPLNLNMQLTDDGKKCVSKKKQKETLYRVWWINTFSSFNLPNQIASRQNTTETLSSLGIISFSWELDASADYWLTHSTWKSAKYSKSTRSFFLVWSRVHCKENFVRKDILVDTTERFSKNHKNKLLSFQS